MVKIEIIASSDVGDLVESYLNRFFQENDKVYFNLARYGSTRSDIDFIYKRTYMPLACVVEIESPSFNGYEIAKFERESDPLVPIFFVCKKGYGNLSKVFETHPYDFLIYPFDYDTFKKSVSSIMLYLAYLHSKHAATYAFRLGGKYQTLLLDDVLFIEKDGHNLVFHTTKGDIVGRGRLGDVEVDLANKNVDFVKCNKGTLANLHFVIGIEGSDLKMLGHSLPISRNEKKKVLQAYKDYMDKRQPHTGRGDGDIASLSEMMK